MMDMTLLVMLVPVQEPAMEPVQVEESGRNEIVILSVVGAEARNRWS